MKKTIIITVISVLGVFGLWQANIALGNPLNLGVHSSCQTASASTTLKFLSAGRATTTLSCDAFSIDPNVPSGWGLDTNTLAVQFTGSSSPLSVLNIKYQFSIDGKDWYDNSIVASTTGEAYVVNISDSLTWTFSSSTPTTNNDAGNASTSMKIFNVPTPTRFVRAVFTMPAGSLPGAIYAEFVPKRQVK